MKHPAAAALLVIFLVPLSAHAQSWSIETVQQYGAYFEREYIRYAFRDGPSC